MAGGSALGVAALIGGIVVGGGWFQDSRSADNPAATAGSAQGDQEAAQPPNVFDQRDSGGGSAAETRAAPTPAEALPSVPGRNGEQGPLPPGQVVPWPGLQDDDSARAGCGPVDRELADALVGEFPVATGSPPSGPAVEVPDSCPPDARAAAIPVPGGYVQAVLAPVRGDGPADMFVFRDDGSGGFSVLTPSGSVLVVLSVPTTPGAEAPFLEQVQPLAVTIGSRF